ncbi:MAG: DUF5130 family protein [Thermocrispum sp.]
MGAGELTYPKVDESDLEPGAVLTLSGRVSAARMHEFDRPDHPFSQTQLARLDEALTLSSRDTGLDFSVYLGKLGSGDTDSRAEAERLFGTVGPRSAHAVLIAVSPGQRIVELVTGEAAAVRLPARSCKLAVMNMVASFKEGDVIGGLVNGLRMLDDQAGHHRH